MKKLHEIINNEINGNLSDARNAIKRLNKAQLINLIDMWVNQYGVKLNDVIRVITRALNK